MVEQVGRGGDVVELDGEVSLGELARIGGVRVEVGRAGRGRGRRQAGLGLVEQVV